MNKKMIFSNVTVHSNEAGNMSELRKLNIILMFQLSITVLFLFLYIYQRQKDKKSPKERSRIMSSGIEATKRVGQGAAQPVQSASKSSNIGSGHQDVNSHNVTNINIFTGDNSGNTQNAIGGDNSGSIFDQAKGCGSSTGTDASNQAEGCGAPTGTEASEQAGGCEGTSGTEASNQASEASAPTGAEASQQAGGCGKGGKSQSPEEKIMGAFQEAIKQITEQIQNGGADNGGGQDKLGEGSGKVKEMKGCGGGKGNDKEMAKDMKEFDKNLKEMGVELPKGMSKQIIELTAQISGEPPEKVVKTLNGLFDQAKGSKSQEKQAA